jgi:molybdopterin converting factor subunit 1
VTVTVRYFAAAREAAGTASERVRVADGATVGDLRRTLAGRHPALGRLASVRVAVDEEFAADEAALAEGAVVALLPPVSGG